MKKQLTAVVLSVVMVLMSSGVFAETKEPVVEENHYSGEYNAFDQIAEYISDRYIDDSLSKDDIMTQGLSKLLENNDPLLVELLKSTLKSLDDYSQFFTAEEYKQYQDQLNQTFYGIGITMQMGENGYVVITGFATEDSKAEKAGFRVGDEIYKVNGEDVTGLSMNEVRDKVIGEENTSVKIVVLRDGEEIELITTRIAVHDSTVSAAILKGNIGYIRITSFNGETATDFFDSLDLMREKNVNKIMLDLRDNQGGLVSTAVEIAQGIVPNGKVIDVKYRQSKYNVTYNSKLTKKEFDFVTLVNKNTASAAEILASAMQDSGCSKLVGTVTFGKAVIQNMYPLNNGTVFKLTVGQYITRNGKEINHIGITPDIEVENVIEKIDASEYAQFDFKTKSSLGNVGDNVKAAKERLYILNFYDESVENDVFDNPLKTAIKDFQQANGLLDYGILDIPTQVKIDRMFSKLETTKDVQMETAYEMCGGNSEDLYMK